MTTLFLVAEFLGRAASGRDKGVNNQNQMGMLVAVCKLSNKSMMLATEMMLAENNTVSSGWDVLEVEQSAFVALIFKSLLLAVFLATTVLLMLALELRRQLVRVRAAVMAVRTTEMAVRLVRMRFAGA